LQPRCQTENTGKRSVYAGSFVTLHAGVRAYPDGRSDARRQMRHLGMNSDMNRCMTPDMKRDNASVRRREPAANRQDTGRREEEKKKRETAGEAASLRRTRTGVWGSEPGQGALTPWCLAGCLVMDERRSRADRARELGSRPATRRMGGWNCNVDARSRCVGAGMPLRKRSYYFRGNGRAGAARVRGLHGAGHGPAHDRHRANETTSLDSRARMYHPSHDETVIEGATGKLRRSPGGCY